MTDNAEKKLKINKQMSSYNCEFFSSDSIEAIYFLLSLPYFVVFINVIIHFSLSVSKSTRYVYFRHLMKFSLHFACVVAYARTTSKYKDI